MEYVPNGNMFQHLRNKTRFDIELARFYGAQVLLAFEYLHELNIIYRDLKPENILINIDGYLKLTDFGFAKKVTNRTWTICGTPEYIAPEVILSKGATKAVDFWSFGVLIYEMIYGFPPFLSLENYDIFEKITTAKLQFQGSYCKDTAAKHLIENLLQKDITKRFGNLKNGISDIKDAKWFETINWELIFEQKINPPFIPAVNNCKQAGSEIGAAIELKIDNKDQFSNEFKDF